MPPGIPRHNTESILGPSAIKIPLPFISTPAAGFSLGSRVQSHTKGIWMWCVPHPEKPNCTLILLDTEGLGDVEKGDNQNDSWIFALAILLSSTFVYNSMGTINQQAMDQLHYVTELTDRIRENSSPDASEVEDSAAFVSFFPDFVWTLRDVSLDLEADGQPISADQYLENSLKLKQLGQETTWPAKPNTFPLWSFTEKISKPTIVSKFLSYLPPGTSQKDKNFNLPRLCIRKFFPKKKCLIFDRPTHRKKLGQLETLHDDELDSEFLQQAAAFCSYIYSNSTTKTLSGGIKTSSELHRIEYFLTPPTNKHYHLFSVGLESLVLTEVNAISSGDWPCVENAVLALAQIENSAAVKKAIAHYDQQMRQKLQLPTDTLQELLDLHGTAELEKKRDDFCKENMKASSDSCSALLKDIFRPLEEGTKQGIYNKPGGYRLFIQKTQELKNKYLQEPRKGVQAEEILQAYLKPKESVTDAILQTDQTLTEKEKETEGGKQVKRLDSL
ncbi:guanylate-binding protein 1-like [Hipposideros larvatus]